MKLKTSTAALSKEFKAELKEELITQKCEISHEISALQKELKEELQSHKIEMSQKMNTTVVKRGAEDP